jgi:hypothetical protein
MNKKTIGVYGDSYANYGIAGKSWVDLLEGNYTVTNFGFPGNSLYHCYKTILSNQKNYDYNIFIVPVGRRFFSRRLSKLLIENPPRSFINWYNNISSIEANRISVENNKKLYSDPDRILKIIDSVYTYWTEWKDDEFDETMHTLMLDDIKKINNTLLINTDSNDSNLGLLGISMWEIDQLGFSEKYPDMFGSIDKDKALALRDLRKNHLSDENNFILYEKILDAINKNNHEVNLSLSDFVKPSKDLEFYVGWHNI